MRYPRRAHSALFVVFASLAAPAARAESPVTLEVQPPLIGPAESFNVLVTGCPGELGIVYGSFETGSTPFPQIGSIDVKDPFFTLFLPPFGEEPFVLPCDPFCIDTDQPIVFYFQAVSLTQNAFGGAVVSSKSEVGSITYDPTKFVDCDLNGEPDLCDILTDKTPDCNGNLIPDSCDIDSGDSADADNDGVPDECQECVAYPAPKNIGDPGRYQLTDAGGNAAPPTYGLRLDGLCGDYPTIYTFTFEAPGTAMFLDYDGESEVRIHGVAYGGVDIGDEWDSELQGFVEIDFTFADVQVQNGELVTFSEEASCGTIDVPFANKTVKLFGKANSDGLVWSFDGVDSNGWVQYETGKPGCCQDFIFDGFAVETVCTFALDNGSFEAPPTVGVAESWGFDVGEMVHDGWVVVDGTVDLKHRDYNSAGALPAEAGAQLLDLHGSGPGAVEQMLTGLVAGKTYEVSLLYAIHDNSDEAKARILVGGGSLLDHEWTATNKGGTLWKSLSTTFVADGIMETLTLVGVSATTDYGGMHVDMVEVNEL